MTEPSSETPRLGRYRLVEKLGQGGMATVWRAEDEQLRRSVAIKMMHAHLAERSEGLSRFVREARAVAALKHRHVLDVYDYVTAEGERPAYLVMELVRGPSLRRFLDEHGAPHGEIAAMIGAHVASALAAAHKATIVHRDVKPENVMVDEDGRVVLCDFGIARITGGDGTMTATGSLIGSPSYMSPEQAAGDDVDHRSDLFSLGTMLYQLATGTLPFVADKPLALLNKIARGDHAPPSAKNPRLPAYLERAIEKCLAVSPDDRFADAAALEKALVAGLEADGLGDVDAELRAYFKDPAAYNGRLEARVVSSARAAAHAAMQRGERAAALRACARVLAWRPDDVEGHALLARLERRRSIGRIAVVAAACVVVAGAGYGGLRAWRAHRAAMQQSPALPVVAVEKTAAHVLAPPAPAPSPPVAPVAVAPVPEKPVEHHKRVEKHVAPAPAPAPVVVTPAPVETKPAPVETKPAPPPAPVFLDGTLTVMPTHEGWCNVFVDGKRVGNNGDRITLRAGPHHLRLENDGGYRHDEDITIEGGKDVVRRFDMTGFADVRTKLSRAATASINGGARFAGKQRVHAGEATVTFFDRDGKPVGREARLQVPATGCVLTDDPPDCVTDPKP